MNTKIKYTIVILIDDQERTYTATGTGLTPWDAVGVAWHRIAKEMGFPAKPPREGQPVQEAPTPPNLTPTPNEETEPRCPEHGRSTQSTKYQGLYCPTFDDTTQEWCKWTYGRPKAKKGAR